MSKHALVSIGLPCYNRAGLIHSAIESALGQDYPNIELVISDNASTDGTTEICRAWAARDARVVFIEQEMNQGPIENFNEVWRHASGEYFVWLGDDDWFDRDYVSSCVRVLEQNLDHVLVYGRARYYRGDAFDSQRSGFSLLQDDPATRVWNYYGEVDDNAMYYGVMRHAVLKRAGLYPNVLGGDWLLMAAVAFQGKVRALDDTCMHRRLGGTSASFHKIVATAGLPRYVGYIPLANIACSVFKAIAWQSPAYAELGRFERWKLAFRCQPSLWKRQIWTMLAPRTFAMAKSPWTRPFYLLARSTYGLLRKLYRRFKARR